MHCSPERDAKVNQAQAASQQRNFVRALELFAEAYRIEQSVFGDSHAELVGTRLHQAQLAHEIHDWQGEIEFLEQRP